MLEIGLSVASILVLVALVVAYRSGFFDAFKDAMKQQKIKRLERKNHKLMAQRTAIKSKQAKVNKQREQLEGKTDDSDESKT